MMSTILQQERRAVSSVSVLRLAKVMVWLSAALGFAGIASATPPSGFSSELVGLGTFDELRIVNSGDAKVKITTQGNVDVYTLRNTFVPGGYIGWHMHPGPSLVTVQTGTATVYHGDDPTCTGETFVAGTGFIDFGDDVHNVRNEGGVNLVLIVVSIVPEGAPRRIDAPSPGNCQF
jgi:quercetin dioxygenase-like cupin family protein